MKFKLMVSSLTSLLPGQKKKSKYDIEGKEGQIDYWNQLCNRKLQLKIERILEYANLFDACTSAQSPDRMTQQDYRQLLGALGDTFLGERLFNAVSLGQSHIMVTDFLVYQDILYYGTDEEKNKRQYLMMNLKPEDDLRIDEYVEFYE